MKKIFYFIAALLITVVVSCTDNKTIKLDGDAQYEKEMDDYYNSLPDTIIVAAPSGCKVVAEKCSGDKYVVGFNDATYWYNKNGEVIDSSIYRINIQ